MSRLEKESAKLAKTLSKDTAPALLTTNEHMRDWSFTIAKIGSEMPKALDTSNGSLAQFLPTVSQFDMFMTSLPGKVTNFNEGVNYGAQAQAAAAARTREWHENILDLADAFLDFGSVVGGALGSVISRLGATIEGVSRAKSGVNSLADGFKKLGSGSVLQGLTGIVGGIGGIVGAAQAAISLIKSLFAAFQSEETKFVNKPRDQFIAQYGGFEAMKAKMNIAGMDEGLTERLTQALLQADAVSEFHKAEDDIIALIGGEKFARGGVVTKPTFGVFGEKGPEAILPLDRLQSVLNMQGNTDAVVAAITGLRSDIGALNREFKLMPSQLMAAALARV
jgi:hypothetical protein